jgi:hypothetical protein
MTYDVVQVAGNNIPRSTLKGIQVASAQSGVSFQYLLAKASQESGFKTDAEAATSSATGLYQFTRGTWLDVFKRHGSELGFGDLSKSIVTGAAGRLSVFDKGVEQKILSLREDPEASAKFAAVYARDNAATLGQNLNRDLDATDLYIAHFLGASGASQMLAADETAPNIYASHVVPDAAKANRSVFFSETGAPRTVRQVVDLIRNRFESQMDRFADVAATMAGEDDVQAMSASHEAIAPAPSLASAPQNGLDFGTAFKSGDSDRMTMSWFVMQELSRMIASQPMSMLGDDEDSESTTSLSAGGFQGEDMSQILVDSMARNTMPPSQSAAITSGQAARAYSGTTRR